MREAIFSSAKAYCSFPPESDAAGRPEGRRRIQPAEREPRRGLTATYCTPNAKPCVYEVSAA